MTHAISHSNDSLLATLPVLQEFLQSILTDINSLSLDHNGPTYFLDDQISKLSLNVSQFVELTTLQTRLLQKRHIEVPGRVKNSHIHLLFVMKGINQAFQKQDLVGLEELIKYELKDNLTQWKIDLIPNIRRSLGL
jgi:hypothetical protein